MGDGRWGKGHFAVTAEYIALNLIKTIFLFFKSIKKKSVISFRSINSSIYPFRFFIQAKYFLIFCILPHSTKDFWYLVTLDFLESLKCTYFFFFFLVFPATAFLPFKKKKKKKLSGSIIDIQ